MATPDLSEFEALASRPKKPPCLIGTMLDRLKAPEREKAVAALGERSIAAGAIEKWFALRDLKINTSAVIAHRNGRCTCANG